MSRPPALTPHQQEDVRRRLAAGEGVRALAREFKVGPATIQRLAGHTERIRNVAEQLAAAQNALAALPPAHQYTAMSLAEKLRTVSDSMADVAVLGADTSRHLHELANTKAKAVNAENLETAGETLRAVAALTKMGNEAAAVPLGLISSTKGKGDEPPPDDLPSVIELVAPDVPSTAADPA